MSKPRILFLSQRLPYPPNRGDRIRAYNLIRFLAGYGDVFAGCVADEPWDDSHIEGLKNLCKEVSVHRLSPKGRWLKAMLSLASFRSATEGAFYSRALRSQIAKWAKSPFDAAVVFCSNMAPYVSEFQGSTKCILMDFVDVDSQKWQDYADESRFPKSMIYSLEAQRVARLEEKLAQMASACMVVSQDEAKIFQRWHPGREIMAISNGVDHEYFSPHAIAPEQYRPMRVASPQLVFVGVLDYFPNLNGLQWFCSQVLPGLRQRFPAIGLDIVGRNPTSECVELGKLPGVRLVGQVDDVRPYILAADIAIAPLRIARGIQNKVLEALACGRPVIASPQAATGIEQARGILIADQPEQWIQRTSDLQSPAVYDPLCEIARNQIVENFTWSAKLAPLVEILGLKR